MTRSRLLAHGGQDSQEPPTKKLAIREEEPEHVKYSFETALKCYACSDNGRELAGTPGVETVSGPYRRCESHLIALYSSMPSSPAS
jgi:ubiquitin carboxyl-terminal hydrolase 5/13